MPPLTHALPRRAHRVFGVPVVAGSIAIAVKRLVEAGPDLGRNGAVELALHRHPVHREEFPYTRGGNLAGIELVAWIERCLNRLERRVERSEEFWRELRAYAFAVLA